MRGRLSEDLRSRKRVMCRDDVRAESSAGVKERVTRAL